MSRSREETAKALQDSCAQFTPMTTVSSLERFAFLVITAYLGVGTCFYALIEEWEWPDSLYFCTVTLLTVGYGDLVPKDDVSKAFTVVYILLGLSLIATSLGLIFGGLQDKIEASAQSHAHKLYTAIFSILLCIGSGTALVMCTEGWGLLDSIYWAVVTCSSVGYGDLAPTSDITRALTTPYLLISVGGFAASLGRFGSVVIDIEAEREAEAFVTRGVSEHMIREMDADGSGAIDQFEFLRYMLVKMGKVAEKDIVKVMQMFEVLDNDSSGVIDLQDVREYSRRIHGDAAMAAPGAKPLGTAQLARDEPAWARGVSKMFQAVSSGLTDLRKPLLG